MCVCKICSVFKVKFIDFADTPPTHRVLFIAKLLHFIDEIIACFYFTITRLFTDNLTVGINEIISV